tara:strand:- start:1656 stop:1982 length:327 start_codon:yes stop_codon:yes gene_type:complete
MDYLYRYESIRYSVTIDADRDLYGVSAARLELYEIPIDATTPKGFWIHGKTKWVSSTSRKRYAHPTKDEALEGYKHRKLAYVKHASSNLRRAEEDLRLVQENYNASNT